MNTDLARDEMISAATPRDFIGDMSGAVCWNVCFHCNRCFIGRANRKVCALCDVPKNPPDSNTSGWTCTENEENRT